MISTDVDSGLPANGALLHIQRRRALSGKGVRNGIRSQMTPVLDHGAEPFAQLLAHLRQEAIRIVPRAQDCHRDEALVARAIGRCGDGGDAEIVDRAATIPV